MNIRKKADEVFDLSLNRSLKNWVDRKDNPANGRSELLAAAVKQKMDRPRQKLPKFNFGWLFRLHDNYEVLTTHSVQNYELEYMDFLKTRMAFL